MIKKTVRIYEWWGRGSARNLVFVKNTKKQMQETGR